MSDTSHYGTYYWCAKVTKDLSPDGEIYVHADDIRTTADGSLEFLRTGEGNNRVNLVIPSGKWRAAFASSVLDGSAVAVEHWIGEVVR